MTRKRALVEVPIPDSLREAVLDIAVPQPDGGMVSVGMLLQAANEAIAKANEALANNGLVDLAVKDLMRSHRRRGRASIVVNASGDVVLRIGDEAAKNIAYTTAPGGAGLPSLTRLREIADATGVDISDLGRRKREIMKRLEKEGAKNPRSDVPADGPPARLRDEVRTSTPLPEIKLPR